MLHVYSIFKSIQGEVNAWGQGKIALFIRLAGCNLRCKYCDTVYAITDKAVKQSNSLNVEQLISVINKFEEENGTVKYITITGGEPLLYKDDLKILIPLLVQNNKKIVIETNGSFELIDFNCSIRNSISYVVDYKLLSSGEQSKMTEKWFTQLYSRNDYVKFVIADSKDLELADSIISKINQVRKDKNIKQFTNFAFSPVFSRDEKLNKESAKLIKYYLDKKGLDYTFNLQIHKFMQGVLYEDR